MDINNWIVETNSTKDNFKTQIGFVQDKIKREIGYVQANINTEIGYTRDKFNRENGYLQTYIDKLREFTGTIVTKLAHGIDVTQKTMISVEDKLQQQKNPPIKTTTQKYSLTTRYRTSRYYGHQYSA